MCKQNIHKVFAAGTFDLFHKGHEFFLREAKKLGDKLYVIVARDETVKNLRKNSAYEDERKRLNKVSNSKIANQVTLGDLRDKYKYIKLIKPDIIALGYDQQASVKEIKRIIPDVKIIRLKSFYPDKYKSSIIRKTLKAHI